eukprot:CAMPEP_0183521182 /NCGR_PEP_ID=MMETSP0371-20130417/17479_1 /TAXON_ID=268820 /ORGANISM="Peridinium aciculiferum, Strain PAER-2" /LENGTH=107 /DNA_ID=CAMNT_0025719685 /DNA_START=256 /DNA_END=576 /DNA_ORIENTATION=-
MPIGQDCKPIGILVKLWASSMIVTVPSMNSKKCAMSLSNVSLGIDTQPVLHVSKPLPSSSTSLMRDFPHREDVEDLELLILWNALKLRGALVHARDLGCRNIIAQHR